MNLELEIKPPYLSVKQWVKVFGYIPEGGIRHLIFKNAEFKKRVVRRVGRRILLDVQELEKFISEQETYSRTNQQSTTRGDKRQKDGLEIRQKDKKAVLKKIV